MPVTTVAAALEAVRAFFATVAAAIPDAEAVIGQPESPGPVTLIACSVLDAPVELDTIHRQTRRQNILAVWMRNVAGQEAESELELAAFKDAVLAAFLIVRQTNGHALQSARLDDTLASLPDYQRLLTGETRMFPMVVGVPITRPLP